MFTQPGSTGDLGRWLAVWGWGFLLASSVQEPGPASSPPSGH